MLTWLSLLLTLCAQSAHADFDLQYGVQGRSAATGAVVQGAAGYSFLVWGQDPRPQLPLIGPSEDGTPRWQYGYVRPVLSVQTAGVMNRATVELEVFPVSILGFAVGRGAHQRPGFSQQFDCKFVSCGGMLNRTTLRAQMAMGFKGGFTALVARKEWVSSRDSTQTFAEEGMGVVGRAGNDQLLTTVWALGYQVSRKWAVGTQFIRGAAIQNPNHSLTSIGFVNYFRKNASIVLGAGTYASDHVRPGFTFAAMVTVNQIRPLGIF